MGAQHSEKVRASCGAGGVGHIAVQEKPSLTGGPPAMASCLRHAIQHGAARGVILSEENFRLIDARYVVKKSRNSVGGGGQNLWALPPADLGGAGTDP
jgi:hypothetical protein